MSTVTVSKEFESIVLDETRQYLDTLKTEDEKMKMNLMLLHDPVFKDKVNKRLEAVGAKERL